MLPRSYKEDFMSPLWAIPSDAKWIDINGYPLTYRDVGSGPTIVLIHGSIVDYRIWEPTVNDLGKNFRVIAPSLRHYFPEPWDGVGSDFTIEQQAADIEALVRILGLQKIHLLGWSRGALVAVELARQSPDLVRTLVLEDATLSLVGAETEASRQASAAGEARLNTLKANIQRGEPERGAQELVDSLNGAGAWVKLPEAHRQMMLANVRTVLADVRNPVSSEVLSALEMPMLLLTGENSPKSYAALYDELRKVCRSGPTVVIPGAAHLMHLDNPDAFKAVVSTFVEQHEAAPT
jgi:pimeloyl-ACP methyl ester carboxylesterase